MYNKLSVRKQYRTTIRDSHVEFRIPEDYNTTSSSVRNGICTLRITNMGAVRKSEIVFNRLKAVRICRVTQCMEMSHSALV